MDPQTTTCERCGAELDPLLLPECPCPRLGETLPLPVLLPADGELPTVIVTDAAVRRFIGAVFDELEED